MIIGVTGTNGAGKTTLLKMLEERGFQQLSLSDYLRDVAEERKGEGARNDRDYLREIGNELRAKHGPGYLMQETLKKIKDDGRYIIDSIRNPGEVKAMRASDHETFLFGVDARPEVRYQRLLSRSQATGRIEGFKTYEEFLKDEQVENMSDPAGQQLHATLDLADIVFYNNGPQDDLKAKIERVLDYIVTRA
jgi:dephospho-CoA kinase